MRKRKGFTLIELLVVVAIIALLISILLPSLSRARELSKRLVCAANVKGIGTSFKIYANDNQESWPVATFNEAATNVIWETFRAAPNAYENAVTAGLGSAVIPGRLGMSTPTTTTLSTTRSLWILVRSGDVTPKQFVCPSSGDTVEQEPNIDLFYDFRALNNISYGYQVPYGPFDTRPSESIDPRMAVAADKGPYSVGNEPAPPATFFTSGGNPLAADGGRSPDEWRRYNSPNHGGRGTGEGQNVLFGDGHATFERNPVAGVDNDNIYTNMSPVTANNIWRLGGLLPGAGNLYYPGQLAFTNNDATTDSVIFP